MKEILIYAFWGYCIGAAATAVMLLWSLIMKTEKVLGRIQGMAGTYLEVIREHLGDRGLKVVMGIVMVVALIYMTLLWPVTVWDSSFGKYSKKSGK